MSERGCYDCRPRRWAPLAAAGMLLWLLLPAVSSAAAGAEDCRNDWVTPSSYRIELKDGEVRYARYGTGELRYEMAKRDGSFGTDMYILDCAVLVRGNWSANEEFKSLMTSFLLFYTPYRIPVMVLAQVLPEGPCAVTQRTAFAGAIVLDGEYREMRHAEGVLSPLGDHRYAFAFTMRSGSAEAPGRQAVFRGEMDFTPPAPAPAEDLEIKGYKVLSDIAGFAAAGSSELPFTRLGQLREALRGKDCGKPLPKMVNERIMERMIRARLPQGDASATAPPPRKDAGEVPPHGRVR